MLVNSGCRRADAIDLGLRPSLGPDTQDMPLRGAVSRHRLPVKVVGAVGSSDGGVVGRESHRRSAPACSGERAAERVEWPGVG